MGSKTFGPIGVLGLYTETPLHCGAESGTGYVDLPIQRERHTNYPVIPGSTLKGVLRDEMGLDEGLIKKYFGSADEKGKEGSGNPGIVSFGDGIVVAFPIRSSGAPFHWITCPFVLERIFRAIGRAETFTDPAKGTAQAKSEGKVLLEEIVVEEKRSPLFDNNGCLCELLDLLPSSETFGYTRKIFLERLLIVTNEDFKLLIDTGTEVLTRIKLNDKGTTGNMFVEEVVPPETLFLVPLRAIAQSGFDMEKIPKVIRVGGDETIGRGVMHVSTITIKGA